MDVDDFLQDLLQALLAHMEVHLGKQLVLSLAPVNKLQILREDLIEYETSQRGLHDARELLALRRCLCHAHLDP